MSMARRRDVNSARKWVVPATCVLAAGGFVALFLVKGQVSSAIATGGIMLGYGIVLVILSRRNEVASILRNDAVDERHASINLRASAFALRVIVLLAVVMFCVQLAAGRGFGPWEAVCVAGGTSYIAALMVLSRRA